MVKIGWLPFPNLNDLRSACSPTYTMSTGRYIPAIPTQTIAVGMLPCDAPAAAIIGRRNSSRWVMNEGGLSGSLVGCEVGCQNKISGVPASLPHSPGVLCSYHLSSTQQWTVSTNSKRHWQRRSEPGKRPRSIAIGRRMDISTNIVTGQVTNLETAKARTERSIGIKGQGSLEMAERMNIEEATSMQRPQIRMKIFQFPMTKSLLLQQEWLAIRGCKHHLLWSSTTRRKAQRKLSRLRRQSLTTT